VVSLVEAVRTAASAELQLRQDEWMPVAAQLSAWLPDARRAQASRDRIVQLKQAVDWMESESNKVRNERFAPIADDVLQLWALLRQSSNVELSDVRLEGKGTRRRVAVDVSVDDVEGAALSVMSQGELHALALSLFLPRATMEQSPFRFIVIDDPVQSMDAARVDGLARALEVVSAHRQIVVFTHDERLLDAFRRLHIEARVLEVTRSPQSVVTVRRRTNPVDDYLDDARSILRTEGVPQLVRRRVVPGLCRNAIEAACLDATRARLLKEGTPFDQIDTLFEQAHKLKERVALAVFGDSGKAGQVLGYLNKNFGRSDTDAFKAIDSGAHTLVEDDPEGLIVTAQRLATGIAGAG
jgi:ABC-type lipoprotein export system ATPase subunit